MTVFSQRDSRWANIALGSSTSTTIGSHGCTITGLGMLANLSPDEVNRRMNAVGGYQNGNLVIWSKINQAIPTLKHLERSTTYNNTKVSEAISRFGGCLVEVDGAPIGGSRHWVVYIGNQKLIDPWDGQTKSTMYYKAVGYSSIEVTQGSIGSTVEVDSQTFEELVRKSSAWDQHQQTPCIPLAEHNAQLTNKQTEIDILYARIEELEAHTCPTVPTDDGWVINGKTVTITEGNTTTTYNYKKES